MDTKRVSIWVLALGVAACGEDAAPEPSPSVAVAPDKPPPPAEDEGPSPCDDPAPQKLQLSAGVTAESKWGVKFTYTVEPDTKGGVPAYLFHLRHGERRWEMQRTWGSWNKRVTWRGFCWKGADRPERRAPSVSIEVAPVCEGGRLVELGGCRDVLQNSG